MKLFVTTPAEIAQEMKRTGLSFDDIVDVEAFCLHFGGYKVGSTNYRISGEPRNLRNLRELTEHIFMSLSV